MNNQNLPTIFHLTHWKAGSQWIYQLLASWQSQRIVIPLPESRQFKGQPVLSGMIYPTLYLTRDEFEETPVPELHVKFAVIRDLRDTLISEYFSILYSHPPMYDPALSRTLRALGTHSLEEGLRFEMRRFLPYVAAIQRSWINSESLVFRYEDFLRDEYEQFHRLFTYCQANLDPQQLQKLVSDFSFEQRAGRSKGTEDIHSHYRKGVAGDWRNYLKGALLVEFKERYDDVLIETGYETSRDWGLSDIPRAYYVHSHSRRKESNLRRRCWCSNDTLISFSPDYDRCSACGSLVCKYVVDRPAGEDDTALYNGDLEKNSQYFSPYGAGMDIDERIRYQFSNNVLLNSLRVLMKYKRPGARLLDVGCGLGAFVAIMRQAGFDAIGLDSNQQAVEFARQTFEIPVYRGTVDDPDFSLGDFDVIVLTNVIEHFPDPLGMVTQCARLLADDGIIVITGRLFDDDRPFEELLNSGSSLLRLLYPLEHTYLFRPAAYQLLLERAGCQWICTDSSGVTVAAHKAIPEIQDQAPSNSVGGYMIQALLDMQGAVQELQVRLTEDSKLAMQQLQRVLVPPPDVALQQDALLTGEGWYTVETYQAESFCWINNNAELIVQSPSGKHTTLALEIEPGPGLNYEPFELQVLDQSGAIAATVSVRGREVVNVDLPLAADKKMIFRLHVAGGGLPTPNDPRILNFRVFRFGWH